MKLIKNNGYCPLFTGFYNTIFESDEIDVINNINFERQVNDLNELPFEAFDFDYIKYQNDVSKSFLDIVLNELLKLEIVTDVEFTRIQSPKEYNFKNDAIYVIWYLNQKNIDNIIKYLQNNWESFTKYIKNNYTSCDGFMSFYSNKANEWFNEKEFIYDEHKLSSIYNFILINENIDLENIHINMENIELQVINYNETSTMNYCEECNSFFNKEKEGGVLGCCNNCLEIYKGNNIYCNKCHNEIKNMWEKRQLKWKITHKIIKRNQILCDECSLKL